MRYRNSVDLKVFVDCEWASDGRPICLQALVESSVYGIQKYLVVNEPFAELVISRGYGGYSPSLDAEVLFFSFGDESSPLAYVFECFCAKHGLSTSHVSLVHSPEGTSSPCSTNLVGDSGSDTESDLVPDVQSGSVPDVQSDLVLEKDTRFSTQTQIQSKKKTKKVSLTCFLYFFYSPKDIWIAIGFDRFRDLVSREPKRGKSFIQSKRNITGKFRLELESGLPVLVKLKDVSGWTNQGLKRLAESLGIVSHEKDLLDDFKSEMETALEKETHLFFIYAMNDVVLLREIVKKQIGHVNWLLNDVFGLSLTVDESTIKMSQGALVSSIFETYLNNLLPRTPYKKGVSWQNLLVACFAKLGILNTDSRFYKRNLELHNTIFKHTGFDSFVEHNGPSNLGRLDREVYSRKGYAYVAYSQASMNYFVGCLSNTSAVLNSLVSGGRCVNERCDELARDYCADVDLLSCYGSSLCSFYFPIGLPSVFAYSPNQPRIKLSQFLRENEHKLVPTLYTITVSGELSFDQDFLFSKLSSEKAIQRNYYKADSKWGTWSSDQAHLAADFVLLRREIKNGVITSDVLEFLRAVCTSNELQEFLNLDVVSAVYWSREDEMSSLEDWVMSVLDSGGDIVFDQETQSLRDTRSRAWYRLPLNDFIGPLVELRKKLKKQARACQDLEERARLESLQQALKLVINTFYGVTASPYFPIGNTVVANNITARARVECYKLAKCLGSSQSVTDGGLYSPTSVFFLKPHRRKPGLAVFSSVSSLRRHRSIKEGPLGGYNWPSIYEDPSKHDWFKELDDLVLTHVNAFWGVYGLKMEIGIEHKLEHCARKASFLNKADYMLRSWDPVRREWSGVVSKVRGVKALQGLKRHPRFDLLEAALKDESGCEISLEYDNTRLLGINEWKIIQKSPHRDESVKSIRPGERFTERRHYRFNNIFAPLSTEKEYKKRAGRALEKKVKTLFERYLPDGIATMVDMAVKDDLRAPVKNTPPKQRLESTLALVFDNPEDDLVSDIEGLVPEDEFTGLL